MKRDFLKIYHQHAATMNDPDQNFDCVFGENNNYHQIGNGHLQFEITLEEDVPVAANRVFVNGDAIRLVNNAFAYCFKEARLATSGGSNIEHIKFVGQVSTIMRVLTSKDGDLLSHFDKFDETEGEIKNTSLHHRIDNHDLPANKGKKIKAISPLNTSLASANLFKRLQNN